MAGVAIAVHCLMVTHAWGLPLDPSAAVLVDEHTDVASALAGSWTLFAAGSESGNLPAHQALLFVDRPARGNRPSGSSFDFIGVSAGQKYWRLPQSQNSKLLYLGANANGVGFGAIASYVETDPRLSVPIAAPWIKYTVVGLHGLTPEEPAPGSLSVWSSEDAGPSVWVSSAAGGLTNSDNLFVIAQSHVHFNWRFTARGIYGVEIVASAYLGPGKTNPTASVPVTFYFGVEAGHPGDATLDSKVDGADYTLWADNFLKSDDSTWRQGDFNLDGIVNGADYTIWADHFGASGSTTSSLAMAVPEPATWVLMLCGALCGGAFCVRRPVHA
jgi:surface-anchored protein